MGHDKFKRGDVCSQQALWAWLNRHQDSPDSVWPVTWKVEHKDLYVSREAVLDALIAHGWIDGRRLKLDEARTMQLISPRKQQAWTQSYKTRAARLEAEGRMHASGKAAVEKALRRSKWAVSGPVDALTDPDDVAAAPEALGATG